MNPKQLERFLAEFTPLSAALLDHTARALRGVNLLPSGGKGFGAVDIEPAHATSMLLAIATVDKPAEAPLKVVQWGGVGPTSGNSCDCFEGAETLAEAITKIIKVCAPGVKALMVCRTAPYAEIIADDGRVLRYGAEPAHFATSWFRLEGGLLHQLAIEIAGQPKGTWGSHCSEKES